MKIERGKSKIRILFFIGYLGIGGKERRLVELLGYLKKKDRYELLMVTTRNGVELPKFFELNIDMVVLREGGLISKLNYIYDFYKQVRDFKPHIIHTWGRMQTVYSLPAALITKTKIVNGQITSAPPRVSLIDTLIDKVTFYCSDAILSNSKAGIESFSPPRSKSEVIYNGIDLKRFEDLPDISFIKNKYQVKTKYLILMVANFTPNKDYEKFFRLGKVLTKDTHDITCMGVGSFDEDSDLIKSCLNIIGDNPFLKIHSGITEVEALVNSCDVGILFSPNGEGISNTIIEYMALCKPVIANDAGGTKELVIDAETGYLIRDEPLEVIAKQIHGMLCQNDLRLRMGENGRKVIENQFRLEKMGSQFEALYAKVLSEPHKF